MTWLIDEAVSAVSVFNTFAELQTSCASGYVPTVRPDAYGYDVLRSHALLVRRALVDEGLRVYPEWGTYE